MHILWRAIEHLDEDFQRGGDVSPISQNRKLPPLHTALPAPTDLE
jgi:hypothetical protein